MMIEPLGPYQQSPIATPESIRPGGRLRSLLARGFDRYLAPRLGVESPRTALVRRVHAFDTKPSRISGAVTESRERAPHDETALISRLVGSLIAAKREQDTISPEYQPGAEWKRFLDAEWAPYLDAMQAGDTAVVAEFARNFFRNEGLTGFWGDERMFEIFAALDGIGSIARAELMQRQVDTWREMFPDAPTAELDAPPVGNPWGYLVDGQLLYEPVCEYHYHAHYARELLSTLPSPVVLEIGGGFGGLAYQLMRTGTDVTYIGLDLPEASFLQGYYLASALPHLKIKTFKSSDEPITAEMVAEYDVILAPNFMLPHVDTSLVDLVVNIRSLSEMPAETVAEYLAQIDRIGRRFVLHENIYKARTDGLHGIPTSSFPNMPHFALVAEAESRWPRYDRTSGYPCREYLLLRRSELVRRSEAGRP